MGVKRPQREGGGERGGRGEGGRVSGPGGEEGAGERGGAAAAGDGEGVVGGEERAGRRAKRGREEGEADKGEGRQVRMRTDRREGGVKNVKKGDGFGGRTRFCACCVVIAASACSPCGAFM